MKLTLHFISYLRYIVIVSLTFFLENLEKLRKIMRIFDNRFYDSYMKCSTFNESMSSIIQRLSESDLLLVISHTEFKKL